MLEEKSDEGWQKVDLCSSVWTAGLCPGLARASGVSLSPQTGQTIKGKQTLDYLDPNPLESLINWNVPIFCFKKKWENH